MLGLIDGAIALLFVGFGGGWGVKSWKDSVEVALVNSQKAKLESCNAILSAANDNCVTDIQETHGRTKSAGQGSKRGGPPVECRLPIAPWQTM